MCVNITLSFTQHKNTLYCFSFDQENQIYCLNCDCHFHSCKQWRRLRLWETHDRHVNKIPEARWREMKLCQKFGKSTENNKKADSFIDKLTSAGNHGNTLSRLLTKLVSLILLFLLLLFFFVTAWQVHLVSASSCVNESKEKVVYCVVVVFHPENWSISSC